MNNTPLVSIIMPAYNSAEFIGEAIKSVLEQTYPFWELLVIDDASQDSTVAIAKKAALIDSRIKLLQNTNNEGTGAARNKGTSVAGGALIAFLDADDIWLPEKLEVQLSFMLKNDLAITFSSYCLIAENGENLNSIVTALPVLTYEKLLKSNYVGNLTGIYNVEKTGKIYAPLYRKRQDWALWLVLLKEVGSTKGLVEPLAFYRKRNHSVSGNKVALISSNFRIYREFLKFSYLKSCRYMAIFMWEHFMVKKKQVIRIK